MKSKTSLLNVKLLGDTLKRNWWVGFIIFLCFLCAVTMGTAFAARSNVENQNTIAMGELLSSYFFSKTYSGALTTDLVLAMLFGAAAGLVLYGYMHSKRQVDFFHSQPVRRETLLATRYVAGLLLFAAGYLINLLLAYIILLAYGAQAAILSQLALRFLFVLLSFAMVFAFSALSAVLTGNAFAHLQAGFMLCFAPFLVMGCLLWFAQTFLKSFSLISEDGLYFGSMPLHMLQTVGSFEFGIGSVLLYILVTGAALALAILLYQKRPSETAGAMFAFPVAEPIYRALLSVTCASLMSSIFYDASAQSTLFAVLGALFGMFLAHIFSQGQFKRSFSGMFSGWRSYAITAAAYLLVMAAFVFDIGAYDAYLPAKEEVQSVSIAVDGYDGSVYVKTADHDGEYIHTLDYAAFDDENLKSVILSMAGAGIESCKTQKASANRNAYSADPTLGYTIRYTLSNGRQVQRSYEGVLLKDTAQELKTLSTDPVYNSKNQLYLINPDSINSISVMSQNGDNYHNTANRQETAALIKALMQDISENGMPADESPLAWVDAEYMVGDQYMSLTLYIYQSYDRCMALLKEWELSTEFLSDEQAATLARAEVIDYEQDGSHVVYTSDDPAILREILHSGMLVNNCPPMTLRTRYNVRFYTREDLERLKEYQAENPEAAMDIAEGMTKEYDNSFFSWEYGVMMGGLHDFGVTE